MTSSGARWMDGRTDGRSHGEQSDLSQKLFRILCLNGKTKKNTLARTWMLLTPDHNGDGDDDDENGLSIDRCM